MMKHLRITSFLTFLLTAPMLLLPAALSARTGVWHSRATDTDIAYTVTESDNPLRDASGSHMTVVYLENLGFDKIGQNTNAQDVAWLLEQGYRVIELDYDGHALAVSPHLNEDIIAINHSIYRGRFCGLTGCSNYRSYILMEGYRIARDVPYYLNDPTVYNDTDRADSLYMDIVYPANPQQPVPLVLSFSYSNSWTGNAHKRLFLGYTLSMFSDSFLEGAPARGIAWAMADHPKYCDWGGGKPANGPKRAYCSYETNPDASRKVRSAIRTVRGLAPQLGLSGQVSLFGFSRGATAASLAIGDKRVKDFEDYGRFPGLSDKVSAAVLSPGVFDYTIIYEHLKDGDNNLEERCPFVWGRIDENYDRWFYQGATYTIKSKATAPVLFFYNQSDELYYIRQVDHLRGLLEKKRVPCDSIVDFGSAHSVPRKAEDLTKMYDFLLRYMPATEKASLKSSKAAKPRKVCALRARRENKKKASK